MNFEPSLFDYLDPGDVLTCSSRVKQVQDDLQALAQVVTPGRQDGACDKG